MSQGKAWFITGASRGFGRIWAKAALERGDKVAATARDAAALDDLAAEYPDRLLPLTLDVTDRPAVFAAVGKAHAHFGQLDVVLCNAGYGYMGAFEEVDFDGAKANFDTNVFGLMSTVQAALPFLRAQKSGHILTLSSVGGILSFPTGGCYVATKWAVEGLSEALAGEVAGLGIKVTIVEPGSYATGFRASTQTAPAMVEYDAVRNAVRAGFKPEDSGDPAATADAILRLVEAENPPLRLILGSRTLPMVQRVYAQRLKSWEEWAEISNAAQGARP
jgi:NADP-dependent 3-hydroxy acid dehydrogenase YdfG